MRCCCIMSQAVASRIESESGNEAEAGHTPHGKKTACWQHFAGKWQDDWRKFRRQPSKEQTVTC